jgi:hypothetical protein
VQPRAPHTAYVLGAPHYVICVYGRYRNASQHRRGVAFQWLRRLCRTLARIDELDVPRAATDLADALPHAPASGATRTLRLPAYDILADVLRRLLRAAALLRAAHGMCERAFSTACSDLSVALFMPLNLVCAATAARLREALGAQLVTVKRSYKAIAMCTTWSTAPGNRSGVRAAAHTAAEARSVVKATASLFGLPDDFDSWLAAQPSFDITADGEDGGSGGVSSSASVGATLSAGSLRGSAGGGAAAAATAASVIDNEEIAGVVVSRLDYHRGDMVSSTVTTRVNVSARPAAALIAPAAAAAESPPGSPIAVRTSRDAALGLALLSPTTAAPRPTTTASAATATATAGGGAVTATATPVTTAAATAAAAATPKSITHANAVVLAQPWEASSTGNEERVARRKKDKKDKKDKKRKASLLGLQTDTPTPSTSGSNAASSSETTRVKKRNVGADTSKLVGRTVDTSEIDDLFGD